jgi:VanZ family protein
MMADPVDGIVRPPMLSRAAAALYLTTCMSLLCFVSWALLTPDPFRIVRDSSLAWAEQVSDLLVHTLVFAALSTAWLGLFQFLRRELPLSVLLVMLGYCVCMESLQIFVPGRHCCPQDAMANIVGFLLGVAIVRQWRVRTS